MGRFSSLNNSSPPRFTNRVTPSVQRNTKPDYFVQPKLARAVHKSEGLIFPSTDQVTRLVNSLLHGTTDFSECFNENEHFSHFKMHDFQPCFNVKSILSGLMVYENKTEPKTHRMSSSS